MRIFYRKVLSKSSRIQKKPIVELISSKEEEKLCSFIYKLMPVITGSASEENKKKKDSP